MHIVIWLFVSLCKGCWSSDPHKRPSFEEILRELDAIARSGFTQTPNESFHTMQDGWKKEIAEVLHELRIKEKVSMKGFALRVVTNCFPNRWTRRV